MKFALRRALAVVFLAPLFVALADVPPPPQSVKGAFIWNEGPSYARLTWEPVTDATGYNVYRFDSTNSVWQLIAASVQPPAFFDYELPGSPTLYAMTAVNPDGESAASSPATVQGDGACTLAVSEPDEDFGTLTPTNALISWAVDCESGADGMLEIGPSPTNLTVVAFDPKCHGYFNLLATNLTPATLYYYRITSVWTNGSGVAYLWYFYTPDTNHPPQAAEVTVGQVGADPTPILLSCEDPDWNEYEFSFRIITLPTNGTLSALTFTAYEPSVWVTYTPNPGARGEDHFQYAANDGELDSAPATVTITNIMLNSAPVAQFTTAVTPEDVAVTVVLVAADADGDPLVFAVDSVVNGSISGIAPNLVFMPTANFAGEGVINFRASDGFSESSGSVTITITDVNDAPVALDQTVTTAYNTPLAIELVGTDIEGSPLSYLDLTQPANASLSGTAPVLLFTPNTGFAGTTSFTYQVNDGELNSAIATVSVKVQSPASVPAAPSNLVATPVSKSQINLAWTDNANNEDGFRIERSVDNRSWTEIATAGPNVQAFASTGLSANKLYYYRVRAFNVLGNSSYSNTASARTPKK